MLCSSEASARNVFAEPPTPSIAAWAARTDSSRRATSATRKPSRANRIASACPSPGPTPTTTFDRALMKNLLPSKRPAPHHEAAYALRRRDVAIDASVVNRAARPGSTRTAPPTRVRPRASSGQAQRSFHGASDRVVRRGEPYQHLIPVRAGPTERPARASSSVCVRHRLSSSPHASLCPKGAPGRREDIRGGTP